MSDQTVAIAKQKMQASIEALERELATIRTGRANPSLIENVSVEVYGAKMRLQELASISAPEPALLVVQPWDSSIAETIASTIRSSEMNLNPVTEGSVIRVPIPPLTQERRQEMVKMVGKKAEDARIAIRSIRHEALSGLKRLKEQEEISENEQSGLEKQIQSAVEEANKTIESLAEHKEQDLLKV